MVVRYMHMWLTIPSLLIPIAFVILLMGLIKIWMFGSPVRERILPSYSLEVMKGLPPDKADDKPKVYLSSKNPYAFGAKPKNALYMKKSAAYPQYTYSAEAQAHRPAPQYPARSQPMSTSSYGYY